MTVAAPAPRATDDLAIRVCGIHKSFGDTVVLAGVDLEVEHGETLVILGGSGSGKSTLLRCMIGLEKPDQGTVHIQGTDIFAASESRLVRLRQRLGMAFQSSALFGSMTLGQNVDLPLSEFTELPESTREIIVDIKLALVGLEGAVDRLPAQLSGGMKKRAAFARAMALDPDILFCDEPSAGLDPVTAAGLDRLLLQLKSVFGITMVVVTHELASAFAIADRLALIHKGRVLITDTPDKVRACTDPIVRQFLDREPEEIEDSHERFRQFMLDEDEPGESGDG